MVPIMGTMSFVRKKSRRAADGRVLDYFYLVENVWEKGRVRQKVVKYLGTSPNIQERSLDPSVAGALAQAMMAGAASTDEVKKVLKQLGIPVTGRLKQVSLVYKPPLRKLTLRVE